MIKKEAEKILIHKDFTSEIQRMWNVKTKVIPGKHEVKELQKTTTLGIAHILWKVLM